MTPLKLDGEATVCTVYMCLVDNSRTESFLILCLIENNRSQAHKAHFTSTEQENLSHLPMRMRPDHIRPRYVAIESSSRREDTSWTGTKRAKAERER